MDPSPVYRSACVPELEFEELELELEALELVLEVDELALELPEEDPEPEDSSGVLPPQAESIPVAVINIRIALDIRLVIFIIRWG